MKRRIPIIAASVLAVLISGAWFFAARHAVPVHAFDHVADGMQETAVRELLGTPHILREAPGGTTYFYGGFLRLRWCSMEVFFDGNDRVTGKFHDH